MRNASDSVAFISALLFSGARKLTVVEKAIIHSKMDSFAGVICDDNFCSMYFPSSAMQHGCHQIRKLHSLLALDYECDIEDTINLTLTEGIGS